MHPKRKAHFISNVDPDHVVSVMKDLDLSRTLVVVVSKSGNTIETQMNENLCRLLFEELGLPTKDHFVAVTSKGSVMDDPAKYSKIFYMHPAVGGRFSVTSMVGMVTLSFSLGWDVMSDFLKGAHDMDKDAREMPVKQNMPLMGALLSIWNHNFLKLESLSIVPYSAALVGFPAHVQQLAMESNGKSHDRCGQRVDFKTGEIVFGEAGTDGQHSYFQQIHQGTSFPAMEFIGFQQSQYLVDVNFTLDVLEGKGKEEKKEIGKKEEKKEMEKKEEQKEMEKKDGEKKDGEKKGGEKKDGEKKDGDKKDADKKDGDKKDDEKKGGEKKADQKKDEEKEAEEKEEPVEEASASLMQASVLSEVRPAPAGKDEGKAGKVAAGKVGKDEVGASATATAVSAATGKGTYITEVRDIYSRADGVSGSITSQEELVANLVGQSIGLATGLRDPNPNKAFEGNRPNHIILGNQANPYTLGQLLAYYEHKIAFQGFIWGINSFDQEGVQLGKKLAKVIAADFRAATPQDKLGAVYIKSIKSLRPPKEAKISMIHGKGNVTMTMVAQPPEGAEPAKHAKDVAAKVAGKAVPSETL
eukprot:TRINITY_DN4885_c1_g1_i3.p1 TRINITY_DN4885_c1_g1~~TRINITY_DN4885_c1_g1_i3.p1  ORF type:complete len:584 (-),score=211.23 TRINITY_DN4885_c1_g1_i3:156-1907(-)